jgi:hypothetical protein
MTYKEVIGIVDTLKPNRFEESVKLGWLCNLEGQIYRELVMTHEYPEKVDVDALDPALIDVDSEMIAPFPHDEVYMLYLQAQIDQANMEIVKYNNSKTMFNNAYAALANWWNRNHKPIARATHFRFG